MMTSDRKYDVKVKENPYLWMSDINFVVICGSIVDSTVQCILCVWLQLDSVIRLQAEMEGKVK